MRAFVSSSGSPASARRSVTRASSRDLASRTAKPSAISADTDSARPSSTSRDAHSYSSSFSEMPIFLVIPQSYQPTCPSRRRQEMVRRTLLDHNAALVVERVELRAAGAERERRRRRWVYLQVIAHVEEEDVEE